MTVHVLKAPKLPHFYYCIRAPKHFAVMNHLQTELSVCRPGEIIVMDPQFFIIVFTRLQFKKAFGHKNLAIVEKDQPNE